MTVFSKTPLLDTIHTPDDLRRLKLEQVRQVADELEQQMAEEEKKVTPFRAVKRKLARKQERVAA